MKEVSTSAAPSSTLFVGSHLDDAGLDVYQFRILGHLHRRAGNDGRAWPSVGTIAEVCKIGERVVRRSLRSLVKLGYVTAQPRPGRTTLYRPAKPEQKIENPRVSPPAPLADQPALPLADRQDEGIPSEGIPTTTAPVRKSVVPAPNKPLERSQRVVAGGSAEKKKTMHNVKSEPLESNKTLQTNRDQEAAAALGDNGIVGAKLESLARSGLSAKEIRKTCRKVRESGGRSGAMVLHLEAAAARKASGRNVAVGFTFKPAQPLPEWQDPLSESERAEVLEGLRKFRQAS